MGELLYYRSPILVGDTTVFLRSILNLIMQAFHEGARQLCVQRPLNTLAEIFLRED